MTYGGNGNGNGNGATNQSCNYMYPGNSDPDFTQDWTEITAGNPPADRRFLVSYGPFTFDSGEMREIDYAFVWARAGNFQFH